MIVKASCICYMFVILAFLLLLSHSLFLFIIFLVTFLLDVCPGGYLPFAYLPYVCLRDFWPWHVCPRHSLPYACHRNCLSWYISFCRDGIRLNHDHLMTTINENRLQVSSFFHFLFQCCQHLLSYFVLTVLLPMFNVLFYTNSICCCQSLLSCFVLTLFVKIRHHMFVIFRIT